MSCPERNSVAANISSALSHSQGVEHKNRPGNIVPPVLAVFNYDWPIVTEANSCATPPTFHLRMCGFRLLEHGRTIGAQLVEPADWISHQLCRLK